MTDDSFMDFLNDDIDFTLPDDSEQTDFDLDSLLSDLNLKAPEEAPDEPQVDEFSLEALEKEFGSYTAQEEEAPTPVAPVRTARPPKPRKEKPAPRRQPKEEDEEELPPSKFWDAVAKHRVLINVSLILVAVLLVGGIAGLIILQNNADPYNGKIISNVNIAGVDVGGMTPSEAVQALNSTVANVYSENNMLVYLGNKQVVLSPSNTHAALDVESAVAAAYAYGRTGSSSDRQKDFHDAQVSPVDIDLKGYLGLDESYIRSMIKDATAKIGGEFTPSAYTLEGTQPPLDADSFDASVPCQTLVFSLGTPGSNADVDGIVEEVLEAYSQRNFKLEVSKEHMPDMPEEFDLNAILEEISIEPVEAVENPATKEVTSGSCGYTFSIEEAAALLSTAEYGDTVSVTMEYVKPNVLDIRGDYPEVLASYSTPVSKNEAYNKNMALLCKSLDGTVLEPGATFSFNEKLPARTAANGFADAPAHGDYCLTMEMGGGADQVATTLFVSSVCANITIAQRANGDHVCGYCINGAEVSVAKAWQDLRLYNTGKEAVIIRAKVTDTQVIIRILGKTPAKYNARLESESMYSAQFGNSIVEKKADEGYTDGQVLIEGISGGSFQLFRVEYDKETDKSVSRTSICYVEVPSISQTVVKIR